jgi:hypothetical protein
MTTVSCIRYHSRNGVGKWTCKLISHVPINRPSYPRSPMSVELIRAGFDKRPDADFFTLRFPRIQEVLWRPALQDAVKFLKCQHLTEECRASTKYEDGLGKEHWLMKLRAPSDGTNQHYDSVTLGEVTQPTKTTNSSLETESFQLIRNPGLGNVDLPNHGYRHDMPRRNGATMTNITCIQATYERKFTDVVSSAKSRFITAN